MRKKFTTRYPDFNVLDKWDSPDWDEPTRELIRRRLEEIPPIRFFNDFEARLLFEVAEHILPQPDRDERDKIPIVPSIDEKLHAGRGDGFRFEDLPPQKQAWTWGLRGIEEAAISIFDRSFLELGREDRTQVLRRIEAGEVRGGVWKAMSPSRFFKILLSEIVKTYYAHPLAWNEVGYNGPSSPRGHVRKWEGGVDPWEAHDRTGKMES